MAASLAGSATGPYVVSPKSKSSRTTLPENTVELELHFLKTSEDIERRFSNHPTLFQLAPTVANLLLQKPITQLKGAFLQSLLDFLLEDPWDDKPFVRKLLLSTTPFWSFVPEKKRLPGIVHVDLVSLQWILLRGGKGVRIAIEGLHTLSLLEY
jgi:hypothetical protein